MDFKPFGKLKMIIWDLDDTFWHGTISEGTLKYIDAHQKLVIDLANRGVVSSICSNNDFDVIKQKLIARGLWDYFVFPTISWAPKGDPVAQIVSKAQLRAPNVLFIDDRPSNRELVKTTLPNIHVAGPEAISDLIAQVEATEVSDGELTRLKQYRILDKKVSQQEALQARGISNEEFLRQCQIKVSVTEDCLPHLGRIHELVERANQLNFTKSRLSKGELKALLQDPNYRAAAISVTDRFGDYGVTGFVGVHRERQQVAHFVFSCRVLNMGIETWAYHEFGQPSFSEARLTEEFRSFAMPDWIGRQGVRKKNKFLNVLAPILRAISSTLYARVTGWAPTTVKPAGLKHDAPRVLCKGGCSMHPFGRELAHALGARVDTELGVLSSHTAIIRLNDGKKKLSRGDVRSLLRLTRDYTLHKTLLTRHKHDHYVLELTKDFRSNLYWHSGLQMAIPVEPYGFDLTQQATWKDVETWKELAGPAGQWNVPLYTERGRLWITKNLTLMSDDERTRLFKENLTWLCNQILEARPEATICIFLHAPIGPDDIYPCWTHVPGVIQRDAEVVREVARQHPRVWVLDASTRVSAKRDFTGRSPFIYARSIYHNLAKDLAGRFEDSRQPITADVSVAAVR